LSVFNLRLAVKVESGFIFFICWVHIMKISQEIMYLLRINKWFSISFESKFFLSMTEYVPKINMKEFTRE
jgi:hypothetical protein